MALEAVCFQQELFGCTMKELCSTGGGIWSYDFGGCGGMEEREEKEVLPLISETGGGGGGGGHDCHGIQGNWDSSCSTLVQNFDDWDVNNTSSSPEAGAFADGAMLLPGQDAATGRRKRRRTKSPKNKEEVENQRMTHIAVERNRRKQMNEYLAVLRSLMPASYVQRGDQASIIGGAINFVKELEQLVQSLEAQKQIKQRSDAAPFADFFTFPQYSSSTNTSKNPPAGDDSSSDVVGASANRSSVADIEVTMVESHANLKVLSRRQPKQLLKLVVGLQSLWLTTLHLNVTTINEMVLYSFSLKVEDECQLTTVDEIAHAVHQMVQRFQDAAAAAAME